MTEFFGLLFIELFPVVLLIAAGVLYFIYGLGSNSHIAKHNELLKENNSQMRRIADSMESFRRENEKQ